MKSVTVKTRMSGGTWAARAGHGKAACTASCTMDAETAAQRAAAKFFRLDASNVLTADDLPVKRLPGFGAGLRYSEALFTVSLPDSQGGAS